MAVESPSALADTRMPHARLAVLGGFQLFSMQGDPVALTARKPRALLAYLALSPGRPHARERLATLLWGDSSDQQARTSLRQALTAVRRGLPEADSVISADTDCVALAPSALEVDALVFEQAVGLGTVEALQSGLQLYRGDLLDGFSADAPAFEQWLVAERERLRGLAVQALSALFEFQRRLGLSDAAVETAARLVALDPLREDTQRDLIRLYLQQGRMVEALRQYQSVRQVLARELGVQPAPETEQLYREIVQQRRTVTVAEEKAAPAPPEPPRAAPAVRHAIVMLADLHRFTTFAGEIDPELVHNYLVAYRRRVEDVVQSHGGIITNYIGARVMAAFGVPVAHDNEAERAVRAALALRDAIPQLVAPGGWRLNAQIGLASGSVFVDTAGAGPLVISGEPVSMAARIMEQAQPSEVLAAGWVRHALGERLRAEALATVTVRGAARPVQVWRLAEWLERVPRMHPFVGRQLELRQIAGLLEGCLVSRTAQVLLVRGEAGIGKTRLLEELNRMARARGFVGYRAAVLDFGVGSGGGAIASLVRGMLNVHERDSPDNLRAAAERAIEAGEVDRERAAFLYGMLELDVPQPLDRTAVDAGARQRAEEAVLASLIRSHAQRTPLLLVVEDLHWADESTLAALARAAAAARALPVILALSTRPDGDPISTAWRSACAGCPSMTLDLGPLGAAEATELARSYSCQDDAVMRSCVARADGNPLFLDQLLRSAQSGSRVLPSTIHSIVLSRLDRLEPTQRASLQAAAVLGQRFSLEAVEHLTQGEACACDELIDKGLVRGQGDHYVFSHALIQEAVYASLLRSRRQAMHQRAAGWFASRDAVLAAEHLDAADDPGAAQAYADAARQEAERFQRERALHLALRGLELARDRELRHALNCLSAELLQQMGRTEESVERYREAVAAAEGAQQKSQALFGLASALRILDRPAEALAAVDRAEAFARQRNDPAELAQLCFLRGNLYFPLGEIDACVRAHEQAREYAEQARSPALQARALGSLGDAHYLRGEMLTAHEYFKLCVTLARSGNLHSVASASLPMVGITHLYRNELGAALAVCHEAAELARNAGNLRAELVAFDAMSIVHNYAGRWQDGYDAAIEALALSQRVGARRFEADARGMMGAALHGMGRAQEAQAMLDEALGVSREVGVKHTGPWILGLIARVTRDASKRESALREGERLLDEGCVSHSHLHFYENAIEVCLAGEEIERAQRYVQALRQYTRREPLPWSEFLVRRALALAAVAGGQTSDSVCEELQALAQEAEAAGLVTALPGIEAALSRMG
jgi:DNA-binding SARP family transcriptional activator